MTSRSLIKLNALSLVKEYLRLSFCNHFHVKFYASFHQQKFCMLSAFEINTFQTLQNLYFVKKNHVQVCLNVKFTCSEDSMPWAVVVAQLVERSLSIPEVCSPNPVIGKKLYILRTFVYCQLCIEKTKIKKKRPGMAHF